MGDSPVWDETGHHKHTQAECRVCFFCCYVEEKTPLAQDTPQCSPWTRTGLKYSLTERSQLVTFILPLKLHVVADVEAQRLICLWVKLVLPTAPPRHRSLT